MSTKLMKELDVSYAVAVYDINGNLQGVYDETDDVKEAIESARAEANSEEYPHYCRAEVVAGDSENWDLLNPVITIHRRNN